MPAGPAGPASPAGPATATPGAPVNPVAPCAPVAPAGPAGPAGPTQLTGSADRDWTTGSVVAHPAANVATTARNSGRFTKNSIEFLIVVPLMWITKNRTVTEVIRIEIVCACYDSHEQSTLNARLVRCVSTHCAVFLQVRQKNGGRWCLNHLPTLQEAGDTPHGPRPAQLANAFAPRPGDSRRFSARRHAARLISLRRRCQSVSSGSASSSKLP